MARLTRIESLLASPIGDADEVAIARLVGGGIHEDTDLEFKQQLYGNGDGDKRALAGDVAALANTVGGVLILGIRDDEAAAAELTPVPLSDGEELRMRQIVASLVAPHPNVTVHRVPTTKDPTHGFYLLEVPRSPHAPHAVRVPSGLRYPKRDGAGLRWLSESEVADAYRNRFFAARGQVERLATVRREGEAALPELGEYAWLSVALVPNFPGEMTLTQQRVQQLRDFPGREATVRLAGSRLKESPYQASSGYRRAVLSAGADERGRPRDALLHLHDDGSGYAAVVVGRQLPSRNDGSDRPDLVPVGDELLTQEMIHATSILAKHAVQNCSGSGDAAIEATVLAEMPMYLSHNRGFSFEGWGAPVTEAAVGRRTIVLDDVVNSHVGAVVGARMVLTDLVQGFGIAESPQLTAGGAVRIRYFRGPEINTLAEAAGLAITDDTLE